GLPVVNNYPGWLAEIIEKNKCGVVVEPGNAEKFADILENLAANKNDLLTMGRNARMLAVKEFSRKKLARSFVDYLEEIAGENKSEAHI
ncbi:glycosyltransferase, partial [Desulfocapsa sp. AH-315-G09]|nr:glycosyltransferase [Desulfocapsa sp. AH-315-G09]